MSYYYASVLNSQREVKYMIFFFFFNNFSPVNRKAQESSFKNLQAVNRRHLLEPFPRVTYSHFAELGNDQSLQFYQFLVIC